MGAVRVSLQGDTLDVMSGDEKGSEGLRCEAVMCVR